MPNSPTDPYRMYFRINAGRINGIYCFFVQEFLNWLCLVFSTNQIMSCLQVGDISLAIYTLSGSLSNRYIVLLKQGSTSMCFCLYNFCASQFSIVIDSQVKFLYLLGYFEFLLIKTQIKSSLNKPGFIIADGERAGGRVTSRTFDPRP